MKSVIVLWLYEIFHLLFCIYTTLHVWLQMVHTVLSILMYLFISFDWKNLSLPGILWTKARGCTVVVCTFLPFWITNYWPYHFLNLHMSRTVVLDSPVWGIKLKITWLVYFSSSVFLHLFTHKFHNSSCI